jgi:CDP-diacylglycerol pyrophosphatase
VRRVKWWVAGVIAALVIAVGAGLVFVWRTLENPDALWVVVQHCVAAKHNGHTLRAGCLSVDLKDGFAILPGIIGRWHYLGVPTVRVTGIEDPKVLAPDAPDYWALAWAAAERYLPSRITKNRTHIALAVNSVASRSQDQLHIHIACLKAGVRRELAANADAFGPKWSEPIFAFHAQMYRVMRVQSSTFDDINPFKLLLEVPDAAGDLGAHTLVVTGAIWDGGKKRGFYILDDRGSDDPDALDRGHGEDLLDEDCRS